MSSTTLTATPPVSTPRPSARRRAAVGASAVLAAALPVIWGAASVIQLATGTEADHRFHQVIGQGVLMCALWLWPILSLARAGTRVQRPPAAAALLHLVVAASAGLCGALAPAGGGAFVAVAVAVTGGLLWAALPVRPHLRGLRPARLDVVLAPLALLTAALVTPFAGGELDLQRAMADEHAEMAHYFDMAFVLLTLAGMLACAALTPAARRLAAPAGAGLAVVGASRWLFTGETTWSLLAVLLGAAAAAAGTRRSAA